MIDFDGIDIVVQHRPEDDIVRRALAAVLGVPGARVVVIDDVTDYPEAGAADVVCVCSPLEGEFARLLSVQVERLPLPYESPAHLMQRFSDILDVQCLSPYDGDMSPYVMWSFSPGKPPGKVALDPVALDEGRYVVVRREAVAQ
jgi:hypothetical protein